MHKAKSHFLATLGRTAALVGLATLLTLPKMTAAKERDDSKPPLGELLDGIVAVVGDHVITRSELAEALAYPASLLKARSQAGMPKEKAETEFTRLQRETLDNLVDNQLILLAAAADGVSAGPEVRRRMEKLKSGFGQDKARLEEFLLGQGFASIEGYEKQMTEELTRQRMVYGQVRPRAEVTAKELEGAFEERYGGERARKKECKGAVITHFTLEQIWYPMPDTASYQEVVEVYTAAFKCYLRLKAGEVEPAQTAADCAGRDFAPSFGQLGEVDETKSFEQKFQEAFESLMETPGRVYSEPFIIKDGVRILRVSSSREGCIDDLTEITRLKDRIKGLIEEEKFQKVLKWWLQELRGKFRVEIKDL